MTPKEKAKELVDKMYNTDYCGIAHFPNKCYCDCSEINIFQAKQCTLIAVEEIINSSPSLPILGESGVYGEDIELSTKYWQQVKTEIEKL